MSAKPKILPLETAIKESEEAANRTISLAKAEALHGAHALSVKARDACRLILARANEECMAEISALESAIRDQMEQARTKKKR